MVEVAKVLQSLEPRRLLSLSVSLDEGALVVVGTKGDDRIEIISASKKLRVQFGGEIEFTAPNSSVKTIVVRGRAGNDVLRIDASVGATGQLSGGGGNDELIGGRKAWRIGGDSGHDTIVGGAGRDVLAGGKGIDTVDYSARTERVWVSLDGKANDGLPAKGKTKGERDNVGVDVENLAGGSGNDRLAGNDLRNVLKGNLGNDTLAGGAGEDILSGDGGADLLQGEMGDDVLIGFDYTLGDKLDGGEGYDTAAFDLEGEERDALLGVEIELPVSMP